MKSSWRNLEKNTGNLFWGIASLIASIGSIVGAILFVDDGDSSMLFVFIPLAIIFLIGSIIFFKDVGKEKEIAQAQKEIEDNNYLAVKKLGKTIADETKPTSNAKVVDKHLHSVDLPNATQETYNIDPILIKNLNFSEQEVLNIPFANITEFMLFVANNHDKSVAWKDDKEPEKLFDKAFKLYEEGNVVLSINTLLTALKINPIFVKARFELINGYLTLKRFDLAKTLLLDMQDYIFEQKDCAYFYRRLGYIYAETNQPNLSYACYRFSQRFEDSIQAKQEISFLKEHYNTEVNDLDISLILSSNKIPLLIVGDLEKLKDQINP